MKSIEITVHNLKTTLHDAPVDSHDFRCAIGLFHQVVETLRASLRYAGLVGESAQILAVRFGNSDELQRLAEIMTPCGMVAIFANLAMDCPEAQDPRFAKGKAYLEGHLSSCETCRCLRDGFVPPEKRRVNA